MRDVVGTDPLDYTAFTAAKRVADLSAASAQSLAQQQENIRAYYDDTTLFETLRKEFLLAAQLSH